MPDFLATIAAPLVILCFLFGAMGALFRSGPQAANVAADCSVAGLGLAVAGGVGLALGGQSETAGALGVFHLDAVSGTMLTLIAFIGLIVIRYSRNYLAGQPRQPFFIAFLCLTLASVTALVTAGDLRWLVAAWIATSLTLHQLLLFYADRPGAVIAARKKFIFARLGDGCVIIAALLLYYGFGTTSIDTILAEASLLRETGQGNTLGTIAAGFLVVAALLKSAQFPTHGWLTEVMETPTPVSALLHAGIVNAGGFLIIRFADIMLLNAPAMHVLALIGGFTALFASVAMLAQSSVKVSLAYSTAAQMGFMLMQCGLGAFGPAMLHIVAHSLYKAHAFLSSGRAATVGSNAVARTSANPLMVMIGFVVPLAAYAGMATVLGIGLDEQPAILTLGFIFVLGLAVYLAPVLSRPMGIAIGFAVTIASTLAYFTLQLGTAWLMRGAIPEATPADSADYAIMALTALSFTLVAIMQVAPPRFIPRFTQRAYVHLQRGLYANAWLNRLIGAQSVRSPAR